jgi:uncharacterized protein YdaU (DUF1376 family)
VFEFTSDPHAKFGGSASLNAEASVLGGNTIGRDAATPVGPDAAADPADVREDRPAQFPYLSWFPRDFASSTRGWPLIARGAYRELLDAEWDLVHLPEDPEKLRQLAGATKREWRTAWPYLEPKFPVAEGKRFNLRLESHRREAIRRYEGHRAGARRTNAMKKARS